MAYSEIPSQNIFGWAERNHDLDPGTSDCEVVSYPCHRYTAQLMKFCWEGGGDSETLPKNKAFAVVQVACSRLERKRSSDNFSKL